MLPFKISHSTSSKYGNISTLLLNEDPSNKFSDTDVRRIQSYLSRGIAVAAQISTGTYDGWATYTGDSVLAERCGEIDHQVVFVGYGVVQGHHVWIVRNSWGSDWGDGGYFYVQRGYNAFCIEKYAVAILPKYYPTDGSRGVYEPANEGFTGGLVSNENRYDDECMFKDIWYIVACVVIIVAAVLVVVGVGLLITFLIVKGRRKMRNSKLQKMEAETLAYSMTIN